MIESSVLCSSAWDSDLFQDFVPEFEPTSVYEAIEYVGKFDSKESKPSSCATTPEDISSASSSDYEFLSFDDLSNILPISDTFVSQILEDENITSLNEFDISSSSNSPKKSIAPSLSSVSSSSSPTKKKKVKRNPEYLSSSKSWSKMSPDEQLRTLHGLSEIVTKHMGIREQMEVIRIIDPTAVISPDDREFALDSSFLNDSKLRRIKDFVKKNVLLLSNFSKSPNSSSSSLLTSKKNKTATQNTRFHRTKRRPRKPKGSSLNESDLREHKVQEQGKKEEQSGLFVYEKRIKKLNNPSEEDEDVNILE